METFRFLLLLLLSHCFLTTSLNLDGLALMEFRIKVDFDPHHVFDNWDVTDTDPCGWSGVRCVHGNVQALRLNGLSLRGKLAPEIRKLGRLKALELKENNFSGNVPKEIGELMFLELLDLSDNNLSGTFPLEIKQLPSLKHLLLSGNKLGGEDSSKLETTTMSSIKQFDGHQIYDAAAASIPTSRKTGGLFKVYRGNSNGGGNKHGDVLESIFSHFIVKKEDHLVNLVRRRLLQENGNQDNSNLAAVPISAPPIEEIVDVPSIGSGSYPALPNTTRPGTPIHSPNPTPIQSPELQTLPELGATQSGVSGAKRLGPWLYVIIVLAVVVFVLFIACVIIMGRSHGVATIGPWKTGLSGQLQKAFVSGVPKLNRAELEAACEDFSNIIQRYPEFTLFKGTLSSGVEIAVASTIVSSLKDWSKQSEAHFRKKVDMLSQVNHKNLVNLLGYFEEDEPFMRMMVFEYAPNGTLFEHLNVKELEHLDWSARMRIVMGITYCLQHMHHELHPAIAVPKLQSSFIYLTEDYAAKIAEMDVWKEVITKKKVSGAEEMDASQSRPSHLERNVYEFGVLLLEIVSGRPYYSEEHGPIVDWAAGWLNDKSNVNYLIDPTLKTFQNNELDVIREVIQDCVQQDPKRRSNMKDVTTKLREVLGILPESAAPRLSPLWWAELEILSVEAS